VFNQLFNQLFTQLFLGCFFVVVQGRFIYCLFGCFIVLYALFLGYFGSLCRYKQQRRHPSRQNHLFIA
jgi:hypothetical protein